MPTRSRPAAFLARLDAALAADRVAITDYAREESLRDFGWGISEIVELLYLLDESDFHELVASTAEEGGMIWVFLPDTGQGRAWLRLCERGGVVVVSLHRG